MLDKLSVAFLIRLSIDPSYKTDLDFWDCLEENKTLVLQPKKYGTQLR